MFSNRSIGGTIPFLALISLAVPFSALAATTPSLGAAATYAVLGSTYTNTSAGTTINGDIGFQTGPAVLPGGTHNYYGPVPPYIQAGADQNTALGSLNSQPCTFSFPAGAINLSTDVTHGPVGVYTAGVYCSAGAMTIGGPLVLSGNGTFIFRTSGALTSTAGATVSLNGAAACNVFWTPVQATTLAANTVFAGTIIDNAGITVGANTSWNGMAMAYGGTVTTDTATITTCTAVAAVSSSAVSSVASILSSASSMTSPVSSSLLSGASSASSLSSSSVRSSSIASSSRSSLTSSSVRSSSVASSAASSSRRSLFDPRFTPTSSAMAFLNVDESIQNPAVPLLPDTGIGPDTSGSQSAIIASALFMTLSFLFAFAMAKQLSSSGS